MLKVYKRVVHMFVNFRTSCIRMVVNKDFLLFFVGKKQTLFGEFMVAFKPVLPYRGLPLLPNKKMVGRLLKFVGEKIKFRPPFFAARLRFTRKRRTKKMLHS